MINKILFFCLMSLSIISFSCDIFNPSKENGTQIVDELYSENTDGSNLKKLADWANFSLAGNYIINNDGKLTEMDVNGSNIHSLLPANLSTYDYSISSDGTKIVFSANMQIYIIDSDGKNLSKISIPDSITDNQSPNISFDNSKIVFQNNSGIFEINIDGNNFRKIKGIPQSSKISYVKPAFSADDQNIIYAVYDKPSGYYTDLHSLNLVSLGDTAFFNINNTLSPVWEISPQNKLLLSYSFTSHVHQIDLNNFKNIDNNIISWGVAKYSSDFSRITYTDASSSNIICIADLTTGTVKKLTINFTNNGSISVNTSMLSPDGVTLIFSVHRATFY